MSNDQQPTSDDTPQPRLSVVGIGASAGGLEALELFFRNMPLDTGMAFVVVQHLSPDFESHMAELLARQTAIPIRSVVDEMCVEPNTIYLLPPRKELQIHDGRLRLADKDTRRGPQTLIDTFLRSLALERGSRAVGIILSGTGSDGARGARDIHDAGGLVIAQREDTAKFDGMPASAIATGAVDLILPPEQMYDSLIKFSKELVSRENLAAQEIISLPVDGLDRILRLLRDAHDVDFSPYKPQTIIRRIQRRMMLAKYLDFDAYTDRLQNDPEELHLLFQDLLIGVTRFFRDAEAFDQLERYVIPSIVEQSSAEEPIRCWVAGCATGEEVYSLAILFHEQIEQLARPMNIKIFASDVHRASLEIAGAGLYTQDALAEMTEERKARYFRRQGDRYQVVPELRQMVVFALHNMLTDAPFTRMDLVSCRNVLIYFQPSAQRAALSLLHFSLKTGGVLFLGSSESPGELVDDFEPVDKKWRLYRKRRDKQLTTPLRVPTMHSSTVRQPTAPTLLRRAVPEPRLLSVYDRLLSRFIPAGFLIDEQCNLLHVFGDASRYIEVRSGRHTSNLLDLLIDPLRAPIADAVRRAARDHTAIRFTGVPISSHDGDPHVDFSVELIADERGKMPELLICFHAPTSVDTSAQSTIDLKDFSREHVETLEGELRFTRESLQSTVEELEASNEELQSTNEELVASNEELQSTNEELHSVNEELYTVNAEHQRKIVELQQLNDDLDNLLTQSEVGVIFLDSQFHIRRFTPKMAELFRLLPQDIGRPIEGFTRNVDYANLEADLKTTLDTRRTVEKEVRDRNGHPFFLRILPYQSKHGADGLLLTLIDISSLRRQQSVSKQLAAIVASSNDPIIGLSLDGTVLSWNPAAETHYGFSESEAVGKPIYELVIPAQWHAELRDLLARIGEGVVLAPVETVRRTKDGRLVEVSKRLSAVRDETGKIVAAAAIDHDLTARKRLERRLAAEHAVSQVLAEARGLEPALPALLAAFCRTLSVDIAEYWELNASRTRLECTRWHTVDGFTLDETWIEQTGRISLARGEGIAGRVWELGRSDYFTRLPLIDEAVRGHLAERAGFRLGFGFPIRAGNRLVGVVCCFARETFVASDALGQTIEAISREVSQYALWSENEELVRRLAEIVEQTPDLVGTCDLNLRLLTMNRAGRELLGMDEKLSVVGLPVRSVHPDWAYQLLAETGVRKAVEFGVWSGESAILGRDGNEVPVSQVLLAHHDASGDIRYFSTIARDLTAQKATETALKRARELAEAANVAKSSFLAHMSHEVRTPMTAIIGLTELLLDQEGQTERTEVLEMIRDNGRYLTEILNDILDLSKIEAGRLDIDLIDCSPVRLLAELVSLMNVRAKSSGLSLSVEYRGPMPEQIQSDPVRLRQILVNLIGNAIKFTEVGGVKVVVTLLPDEALPKLEFRVIDTGCGISPAEIEHIFEPFVQVSRSLTSRRKGTGLGLAISRRLAEALGGKIAVNSEVGHGSEFILTIATGPLQSVPLLEPGDALLAARDDQIQENVIANFAGRRVLVAEDTLANQFLIRRILEQTGAEVMVVENGKAALDAVTNNDHQPGYDVILMDMHMPVMNGFEAARILRNSGCTAPIIALTAGAMHGDRERCLEAGCIAYVAKPIDRNQLLSLLNQLFGN